MQPLLQFQSNNYYMFRMCVYSLRYLAWIVHAPYCHLWPVWVYLIFPHPINGTNFEKMLLNIKFVFWFSLQRFPETFHLLKRNERDMTKTEYWSSCKVAVILVRFECNLNFMDRFSINTQILNFVKIRLVGIEVFHADRRTDVTKLIVAFNKYANTPKTQISLHLCGCEA